MLTKGWTLLVLYLEACSEWSAVFTFGIKPKLPETLVCNLCENGAAIQKVNEGCQILCSKGCAADCLCKLPASTFLHYVTLLIMNGNVCIHEPVC